MRDNMIINMSGHAGKGTGVDMNIEHLIRNDKVCTVLKMTYYTKSVPRSSFSFEESMRTGTVSEISPQFVPCYRSSRNTVVQNSVRSIPGLLTPTLTPVVTSG